MAALILLIAVTKKTSNFDHILKSISYYHIEQQTKEDYLAKLCNNRITTNVHDKRMTNSDDILIRIEFDALQDDKAYVSIVNKKGNSINPDYRNYTGELFNILRKYPNHRP